METRTRKFTPLFSIMITHAWFGASGCPYISLEPDADCRLLLARKKLICKKVPGGLQIISETGGLAPAPDHYRFYIRLDNVAFFAVTKLDFADFPGQLFCFSNTAKNKPLSVKKYPNPGGSREAILGIVDIVPAGNAAGSSTGTGAPESFLLSFNASLS
jgi:hypothetical protein